MLTRSGCSRLLGLGCTRRTMAAQSPSEEEGATADFKVIMEWEGEAALPAMVVRPSCTTTGPCARDCCSTCVMCQVDHLDERLTLSPPITIIGGRMLLRSSGHLDHHQSASGCSDGHADERRRLLSTMLAAVEDGSSCAETVFLARRTVAGKLIIHCQACDQLMLITAGAEVGAPPGPGPTAGSAESHPRPPTEDRAGCRTGSAPVMPAHHQVERL